MERKENRERHQLKLRFWTGFLEWDERGPQLYRDRSPITGGDLTVRTGVPGVEWLCRLNEHEVGIYLKFASGPGPAVFKLNLFHRLSSKKGEIEAAFGGPLCWETTPRGVSLIGVQIQGGYRDPASAWPLIQEQMVVRLAALERALTPYLRG